MHKHTGDAIQKGGDSELLGSDLQAQPPLSHRTNGINRCHKCPRKTPPIKPKNISHPAKTDSHGAKLQGTLAVETVYQKQAALPMRASLAHCLPMRLLFSIQPAREKAAYRARA